MKLILNWLLYAAAIVISAYILPGVSIAGFTTALILAIVLGAINLFIKPILFILTLPITILTLGVFALILNALLIELASVIVPGFEVAGFLSALLFSLVLSVIHALLHALSDDLSVRVVD